MDNKNYNYEFVVERKYPLLDLLEDVENILSKQEHIRAAPVEKFQEIAENRRIYIRNRLQIIFWVVEDMVKDSPSLIENGGYMGAHTKAKQAYPKAIKALKKVRTLTGDDVQAIDDLVWGMRHFLLEST